MIITIQQAIKLLESVSNAAPDDMNCEGCFELISELADAEHRGWPLSDRLESVRVHLSQCTCCAYEYESLLEAIDAANENEREPNLGE